MSTYLAVLDMGYHELRAQPMAQVEEGVVIDREVTFSEALRVPTQRFCQHRDGQARQPLSDEP